MKTYRDIIHNDICSIISTYSNYYYRVYDDVISSDKISFEDIERFLNKKVEDKVNCIVYLNDGTTREYEANNDDRKDFYWIEDLDKKIPRNISKKIISYDNCYSAMFIKGSVKEKRFLEYMKGEDERMKKEKKKRIKMLKKELNNLGVKV